MLGMSLSNFTSREDTTICRTTKYFNIILYYNNYWALSGLGAICFKLVKNISSIK